MLNVVLTGPLQFDGLPFKGLGHLSGLNHEVWLRFTAKTATQQGLMNGHVFQVDLQKPGDAFSRRPGVLHWRPGLGFAPAYANHGDGGLHGSLSHMGHVVGG